MLKVRGAKLTLVAAGLYDLLVDLPGNSAPAAGDYRHTEIVVDFVAR